MINNIANASFTMNRIAPYLRRLAKDDQVRGFAEQWAFLANHQATIRKMERC